MTGVGDRGAVDAAIMWNGVAHTFRDSVDAVPLPYEYEREVKVYVMGRVPRLLGGAGAAPWKA